MSSNENISEMLVHVAGDLLNSVHSVQEMQARLDIVKTAWNMSLNTREERKVKLKKFLKKQKNFAPNKEALKSLESEMKRIMKQKIDLYPNVDNKVTNAEAIEKEENKYEVKAYFEEKDQKR